MLVETHSPKACTATRTGPTQTQPEIQIARSGHGRRDQLGYTLELPGTWRSMEAVVVVGSKNNPVILIHGRSFSPEEKRFLKGDID
jgi:hypothetical protein